MILGDYIRYFSFRNPYKLQYIHMIIMFKDFIDLKVFLLNLKIDENCIPSPNLKCCIFGHVPPINLIELIKNLKWEKLSDGFKYKEIDGICKRCRTLLILYQYPQWKNDVFSIVDCREKMVSW